VQFVPNKKKSIITGPDQLIVRNGIATVIKLNEAHPRSLQFETVFHRSVTARYKWL